MLTFGAKATAPTCYTVLLFCYFYLLRPIFIYHDLPTVVIPVKCIVLAAMTNVSLPPQ